MCRILTVTAFWIFDLSWVFTPSTSEKKLIALLLRAVYARTSFIYNLPHNFDTAIL